MILLFQGYCYFLLEQEQQRLIIPPLLNTLNKQIARLENATKYQQNLIEEQLSQLLALTAEASNITSSLHPSIISPSHSLYFFRPPIINFHWLNMTTLTPNAITTVKAYCSPGGGLPIGAGYNITNDTATIGEPFIRIHASYAFSNEFGPLTTNETQHGWQMRIQNTSEHPIPFQLQVFCVSKQWAWTYWTYRVLFSRAAKDTRVLLTRFADIFFEITIITTARKESCSSSIFEDCRRCG